MRKCVKKPPTPRDPVTGRKIRKITPIVFSASRYQKILNHARNTENLKKVARVEEEVRYRQYLKDANDELMKLFSGNIRRTQEQKLVEVKKKLEEKYKQAQASYNMTREHEEKLRHERIEKAKLMMERLRPGARALQSALVECETIRVRGLQQQLKEEYAAKVVKQECEDEKRCANTKIVSIRDQDPDESIKKQLDLKYQDDILKQIEDRRKQRERDKEQKLFEDISEREQIKCRIAELEAKEKEKRDRKRQELIDNHRQGRLWNAQKQKREQIFECIDQRKWGIYNLGKTYLNNLTADKIREERQNVIKDREMKAVKVCRSIQAGKANDGYEVERDVSRSDLKNQVREVLDENHREELKAARLEAHCARMARDNKERQRKADEKRFEMALRFKNDEVNCYFRDDQDELKQKKLKQVEAINEENLRTKRVAAEKKAEEASQCKMNEYLKDDRFFYNYAAKLCEESKEMGRPFYPIIKTVNRYKRDNRTELAKHTPKYLSKSLNFGPAEHGSQKAARAHAEVKQRFQCQAEQNDDIKSIDENCLKIAKMSVTEPKVCKVRCPIKCYDQNEPPADDRDICSLLANVNDSEDDLKKEPHITLCSRPDKPRKYID